MLTLAYPWLLVLLPLPLLFRPKGEKAPVAAPHLPTRHWLASLPGVTGVTRTRASWRRWLALLSWIALVVALARPQWVGAPVNTSVSGRDIMLAVDISPSMQTHDMVVNDRQVSRIHALKRVVGQFIAKRKGDRIGLILFGTRPYIQAPLTFDHKTLKQLLDEAEPGMAGRATAIGDAIGLAVKRLKNRPEKERVLILLTDGANNAGALPPAKAAQIAHDAHVKIYTIGIGATSMEMNGFFGPQVVNPSQDMDVGLLKKIAKDTGGHFFRATSTPKLAMIYQDINKLEPINLESRAYRPTTDLFYWPLALAMALLLIVWVSRSRLLARALQPLRTKEA